MAKTFTYDPTKIADFGINQMRFELGDTDVEGGDDTCALCDEEIGAMIDVANKYNKGWRWGKLLCLKAIRMKFSFEVDYSAGGMNLSLENRFKVWDTMYKELSKSFEVPKANSHALGDDTIDGGHYFRLGLGENYRSGAVNEPWRK